MGIDDTYIKLSRKILRWAWYKDALVKSLFIHLLLTVNSEARYTKGQYVKRGQLLTSVSLLSEETGMTPKQLRTALNKLKKSEEIRFETHPYGTLITVPKYELYQNIARKADPNEGEVKDIAKDEGWIFQ